MSKRKDRRHVATLFENVSRAAGSSGGAGNVVAGSLHRREDEDDGDEGGVSNANGHADAPISDAVLASSPILSTLLTSAGDTGRLGDGSRLARRELPKMKKFRFQLLHEWLTAQYPPGRVADVGGGKGLLAYLLQQSGWAATVVDPVSQPLPAKYKDLATGRQVRVPETDRVPRRDREFTPEMAEDFDLLVAMHAHGCNMLLLDAAARYGRRVVLLPCCIIHEPVLPPPGIHWLQCVVDQATARGLTVTPFRLNFKGQNIGIAVGRD